MPHYLPKHALLGLVVSVSLMGCGDGGTDPSKQIEVSIVSGDGQSADVGEILPQDLVVRSTDLDGNALENVELLFSVTVGGGSLSQTAVATDAQGLASTTWMLGPQEGEQNVNVAAVVNTGAQATFSATATDFQIEIVFINHGSASQDAIVVDAADRWMTILRGELANVNFSSNPVAAGSCTPGQPTISDTVDDLRVFVDVTFIDGLGGTLARAGPCQIRSGSQLPAIGYMQFESADLPQLEQSGDLASVTLHEMGHVLGIGTLWTNFSLLMNPSLPSSPGVDTHFAGAAAIAAFDAAGGTAYMGAKVPVENLAGAGSADSHWRESVLKDELFTPLLTSGMANPLSAITLTSLVDMGYMVDASQADPFTVPFPTPARLTAPGAGLTSHVGKVVDLGNDTYPTPLRVVDESGSVTKIIVWR